MLILFIYIIYLWTYIWKSTRVLLRWESSKDKILAFWQMNFKVNRLVNKDYTYKYRLPYLNNFLCKLPTSTASTSTSRESTSYTFCTLDVFLTLIRNHKICKNHLKPWGRYMNMQHENAAGRLWVKMCFTILYRISMLENALKKWHHTITCTYLKVEKRRNKALTQINFCINCFEFMQTATRFRIFSYN